VWKRQSLEHKMLYVFSKYIRNGSCFQNLPGKFQFSCHCQKLQWLWGSPFSETGRRLYSRMLSNVNIFPFACTVKNEINSWQHVFPLLYLIKIIYWYFVRTFTRFNLAKCTWNQLGWFVKCKAATDLKFLSWIGVSFFIVCN